MGQNEACLGRCDPNACCTIAPGAETAIMIRQRIRTWWMQKRFGVATPISPAELRLSTCR